MEHSVRKQSGAQLKETKRFTLAQSLAGGPRKHYTKEELLDLFEQTTKIDETVFEKTSLSENQYLLISSDPEEQKNKIMSGSLEDEEDENDGFGLLPESLKKTQKKVE